MNFFNITHKKVISKEARQKILSVHKIGIEAYNKLHQEMFIDKFLKISDTIHRVNMNVFCTNENKSYEHIGKKKKN